jgi:hypothetical protein
MELLSRVLSIVLFAVAGSIAQTGYSATPPVHFDPAQTPVLPCDDVTKLDFRNLTFQVGPRTFAFHEGVAVNYDGRDGQAGRYSQPDWKAEIEKDSVIQPVPDVVVRFLLIHDVHVTGSGWRYYATGYHCSGGKLQEVIHREGMSLRVERLDSVSIDISLDPLPGKARRKLCSYIWDRSSRKYVLSSTPEHSSVRP